MERETFLSCVASEEAAALRHVFFAEREARKIPDLDGRAQPRPLERLAVIGAGLMGGGVAISAADGGLPVTLIEQNEEALARGLARIDKIYGDQVKKGRLSQAEAEARRGRISTALTIADGAREADLVIEAVFEDLEVKKSIFAELARHAKPGAVLATNTSYLDVNEIAAAAGDRAADVLGAHFFSPANVMKLLEIVRAEKTDDGALLTALELGKRMGKTAIVAGVCRGFIANRIYTVYLAEAEYLLLEGASCAQVDQALKAFGFPMGPFAVRDMSGLEIG